MKVIKLTESELNRIIKRVLQTEQESEEEPDKNLVVGLRNFSKGRISKDELYRLDDSIYDIDVNEPLGQSIITIQFEDDKELFKELDIDEQDIWFMGALNSYNGYEFNVVNGSVVTFINSYIELYGEEHFDSAPLEAFVADVIVSEYRPRIQREYRDRYCVEDEDESDY